MIRVYTRWRGGLLLVPWHLRAYVPPKPEGARWMRWTMTWVPQPLPPPGVRVYV